MNITSILELLSFPFLQRAFIVGALIAISSSFLGIFLVLRKYSMIGDGLAHVSFATVALALLLNTSPLIVSIFIVTGASLLILKLSEENRIGGDAAIALVASTSVALGVFISSLASGFNVDLFSYLFGSILIISKVDVILSVILSLIVIAVVLYFYHDLFSVTYDSDFAKVSGINTTRMNQVLAILTSITIVLGIRVVGTMLISSFIIFPTVIALKLQTGFKRSIALAVVISLFTVISGILVSIMFDFPTGATIVLMNALLFIIVSGYSAVTKRG
ncbi:MAG: metal ABC transporter permease [Erysipelothrix sp.]|jgi:zinc transport system permease protein|nr:metal ABC transporter permease [Erysipelothrix sp.]